MFGLTGLLRRKNVAEGDDLAVGVGNLDADGSATWNRGEDPDIGRRHGVGDVFAEALELGDLHAFTEFEHVPGDRGTHNRVEWGCGDAELIEGVLQETTLVPPPWPCRSPASVTARASRRAAASSCRPTSESQGSVVRLRPPVRPSCASSLSVPGFGFDLGLRVRLWRRFGHRFWRRRPQVDGLVGAVVGSAKSPSTARRNRFGDRGDDPDRGDDRPCGPTNR